VLTWENAASQVDGRSRCSRVPSVSTPMTVNTLLITLH
jgi:hypothetical protein